MIQFIIPGIAAAAYAIYKYAKSKKKKYKNNPSYQKKSRFKDKFEILRDNFLRLLNELDVEKKHKCLIIGQPGSGKSTILWNISNKECYPKPQIGVVTDATDWADFPQVNLLTLYNDKLFADTPGYGTYKHPASIYAKYFPFNKFNTILLVLNGKIKQSDDLIIKTISNVVLKNKNIKLYIIRTHSESLSDTDRVEIENDLQLHFKCINITKCVTFVSNKTNFGIEEIRKLT